MREKRSPTQILFSHLPAQTIDAKGRIWKVREWTHPIALRVDTDGVRQRLISTIDPWRVQGTDDGLTSRLYGGWAVEVVGVNPDEGVAVEPWPNVWRCHSCRRVTYGKKRCECGADAWAQLHFVAFHECGYLGDPMIPKCPDHNQARINHTSSSSVRDLQFSCPVCNRSLTGGLGQGRPGPG